MANTDAAGNPIHPTGGSTVATEWGDAVADHIIPVYTDTTQRDAIETAPAAGRVCYITADDELQAYDGSAWVVVSEDATKLPTAGGTMSGVLVIASGTAALPGVAITDLTTGFYRPAADQLGLSIEEIASLLWKRNTANDAYLGLEAGGAIREIFPKGTLLKAEHTSGSGAPTSSDTDLLTISVTLEYSGQPVIVDAAAMLAASAGDENEGFEAVIEIDGTEFERAGTGLGSVSASSSDVSGISANASAHAHNSGSYTAAAQAIHVADFPGSVSPIGLRSFTPAGSSFDIKLVGKILDGSPTGWGHELKAMIWRG